MEHRRYSVVLKAEEPLHIGTARSPITGTHGLFAQINNKPLVPGSSLKGALRAEIERYLIEKYLDKAGMKPCIPSPERNLSAGEKGLIRSGHYKPDGGCEYREKRGREKSKTLGEHDYICPACYLLGAQGLPGFLRVPYLFTDSASEVLYGVRIDRATNTVVEGTNRDYQIIPPGTEFKGTMGVVVHDPLRNWHLGSPGPSASSSPRATSG